MGNKLLIITSIVLILLSCQKKPMTEVNKLSIETGSVFETYLIPQIRENLLEDLQYKNIYKISLNINRKNKEVLAKENLIYYNNSGIDLEEIHFRLYPNSSYGTPMLIKTISIEGKAATFSYKDDYSTLIVNLDKKLLHGKKVDIVINYNIDYTKAPDFYFGFARIDDDGFSLPHFYPTAARITKGKWENDELVSSGDLLSADSSWFLVQIETDSKVKLVTSGMEISSEISSGIQKRIFTAGPVRDFYICGDESFIPQISLSGETRIVKNLHQSTVL